MKKTKKILDPAEEVHMNVKGSLSERNCVITHHSVSLSLSLINTKVLI